MCVFHNILDQLLLIRIGVDIADDVDIHLDIVRRQLEQTVAVAVTAAPVIQRERALIAQCPALALQRLAVDLLFLGDLDDQIIQQLGKLRLKFRNILIRQAAAGNRVEKQLGVPMQPPPVLHHHKRGCRLEGGQPLNLVQLVHLARQLHHGQRRTQKRHFHTQQRLIRLYPAGMR